MSRRWQSGDFDRQRLRGAVRQFAPAHAAESLPAIDLQRLYDKGKRLILLDVDHTLVEWKAEEFAPEVVAWVERAKAMGFGLCIISNTHRLDRLERLKTKLGVETVRGRFKPSTAMFRLALIKFDRKPEEAVMVGDQMMTDVLGANRAGIDAIWVRKMDGKEFSGTRLVNRTIERFLTGGVYKALVAPVDEPAGPDPKASLLNQLVKFGIVGGTSFAIDYCIRMTLRFAVPWKGGLLASAFGGWLLRSFPSLFAFAKSPEAAALPFFIAVAALVAMVNSFFLNRLWTFQIRGRAERTAQFRRFAVVSLVGVGLNIFFSTLFNHLIPGDDKASLRLATVLATIIVGAWNFSGQRLYAFRAAKP